jgi:hypothetical protein
VLVSSLLVVTAAGGPTCRPLQGALDCYPILWLNTPPGVYGTVR